MMIKNNQNEQIVKIGNWVASRLNKFESILTFVFLLTMALKMWTQWNVTVLLVLTLIILADLYFFNAFSMHKGAGGFEIFLHKLVSVSCSVTVIGILFRIGHWSGYHFMLICGCSILFLCLAGILYLKSTKTDVKIFDSRLIIRIITIAIVGIIMLIMSPQTIKEAIV